MEFDKKVTEKSTQSEHRIDEQFVKTQPMLPYTRAEKRAKASKRLLWVVVAVVVVSAFALKWWSDHKHSITTEQPKVMLPAEAVETSTAN